MTKLAVYWATRNQEHIRKIRERFGIPAYTTINGESPAEISDEDMPLLLETERRGFIAIRKKKWRKNGGLFSFISR